MARGKRPRKAPAFRSLAQKRAYLAGQRHGKALAAKLLTKKRKAAALKAAETRAKRKGLPPKRKRPPVEEGEAVTVAELVLYEAPSTEGVPILSGLDFAEWILASAWQASVELWIEGQAVAEGVVPIPADWDTETAAKLIRRQVRSWYKEQIESHPEWAESPVATLIRLILRRT